MTLFHGFARAVTAENMHCPLFVMGPHEFLLRPAKGWGWEATDGPRRAQGRGVGFAGLQIQPGFGAPPGLGGGSSDHWLVLAGS